MTIPQDGCKFVRVTYRPPLITYSMVHSPSWAANWFAASQEIPRISRNPKVHYLTHNRPPPVSILGQSNPVHIPTSHLLEIHPNIIHPSTPRSPQWSLSLLLSHQDLIPAAFTPRNCSWYSFLLQAEHFSHQIVLNKGGISHYFSLRTYTHNYVPISENCSSLYSYQRPQPDGGSNIHVEKPHGSYVQFPNSPFTTSITTPNDV